jgi:hypothetical protein
MKTYRAGMSELVRPTISLSYPKRQGQHLLELFGKVAAVAALCIGSFWLGRQFSGTTIEAGMTNNQRASGASVVVPSESSRPVSGLTIADTSNFEDKELDGIQIQTFTLKPDAVVPGELDYELVLANNGPKLIGEMKLVVQGEMDGKPMIWTYPDDARPTDQHIKLSVSRYLKTAGAVQLPSKFVPLKAALKLQQDNGLRGSRVVQIAGNANNGLPYR